MGLGSLLSISVQPRERADMAGAVIRGGAGGFGLSKETEIGSDLTIQAPPLLNLPGFGKLVLIGDVETGQLSR